MSLQVEVKSSKPLPTWKTEDGPSHEAPMRTTGTLERHRTASEGRAWGFAGTWVQSTKTPQNLFLCWRINERPHAFGGCKSRQRVTLTIKVTH